MVPSSLLGSPGSSLQSEGAHTPSNIHHLYSQSKPQGVAHMQVDGFEQGGLPQSH